MIIRVYYCSPDDNYKTHSIDIESNTSIGDFLCNIMKFDVKTEVGVYGKLVDETYIIKDNDRIEVYEKILADPKVTRKRRASNEKC